MSKKNILKYGFNVPKSCIVTGGSGFVGQRLVEMLVERGCKRVISFDIAPKPKDALDHTAIEYCQGDLSKKSDVFGLCNPSTDTSKHPIECVFHIAALVGPYHAKEMYRKVNYDGSVHILNMCKEYNIKRIVMSSRYIQYVYYSYYVAYTI